MNGVVRADLANFVMVGLMAFLFVFAVNRLLDYMNLSQWKA